MNLISAMSSSLALDTAVETGSYLGDSAKLLNSIFPRVLSIEISRELFEHAALRHADVVGLTFVHGSSPIVLPGILEEMQTPALFWLDGHWCSGQIDPEQHECPVLDEIRIIDQHQLGEKSCLLIDDARLFLGPPPPPHRRQDWPTFMEVADLLRAKYPRYVTVLDDVVIAGPPEVRRVVDDYWLSLSADPLQRMLVSDDPSPSRIVKAIAWRCLPETARLAYRRKRVRKALRQINT